jgi:hypothetical protein
MRYPHKAAREILEDLLETTPGDEGKWFAAVKEAGLFEEAIALATRSPVDPRTLNRAAGELVDEQPRFALQAGMLALQWLVKGYGAEVRSAYARTLAAAERVGCLQETRERVRQIVAGEGPGGFVTKVLGRELGV